jgi:DNA-binding NtrC family response regulator
MSDTKPINLLIVDDDSDFRDALVTRFKRRGFRVQDAGDASKALGLAERCEFDVAVFDVVMPGVSGLQLLEQYKQYHADSEVIMLTGQGTIETAVEAMKLGAYDFLTKPFSLQGLESLIEKACERRRLKRENEQLRALLRRSQTDDVMVGQSQAMREIFRLIERAGPSDKAILIQGESGTGKELVARALHRHSRRCDRPMVVINCAALPESLLESELFGHERGAFTGAMAAKQGLFEVADGGTLFIDEIGEMPGALQAKLLRVLEDGSMRRIGSIKERRVNVRLLAATNQNLSQQVREGRFREDLYYRINVLSIELPPLRERREDIPLLIRHFVSSHWKIAEEALETLCRYDWPGNVRQLINAVERAKIMAEGSLLRLRDFPREATDFDLCEDSCHPVEQDNLAAIERFKVVEVLRREGGNKARAARALGIDRRKLYRLVEKHDINATDLARRAR